MKKIACIICAAVLLALTLSGCLDIGGSFKPGSFGKKSREKAMVEAIAEKYGDMTGKGDPRFLEARMTSRIEEFIPVDTVTKYSADAKELYVWFVYDNFGNDEIEVEWIYLDDDYSIHTFKVKTGEDFGRGAFILEQPDDGWVLGNYKVIIRGRGIEEVLTFSIIEGATVAVPLPFENGKITLEEEKKEPGWYFTHWEYYKNPNDTAESGPIRNTVMGTTDIIWDHIEGTGEKNNFTNKHWRTDDSSNIIAYGEAVTKWTDPPEYFSGTDMPSITVDRSVESDWGISGLHFYFDIETVNPGGATEGKVMFVTPDGESYVQTYQGTLQMKKAVQGREGRKMAIILYLNGDGFKYYYVWREAN